MTRAFRAAIAALVAAAAVTLAYANDDKASGANALDENREADKRDAAERRDELSARQARMVACNKEAREKEMRGAVRKSFVRECLKSDTAAAGGQR
jgi:hypothetical protein